MPELKMPQLGESVVEGTITRWLKKEGEDVAQDELLVEISTDKVDSEVPSSFSGKLTKILVPEGETVQVGTAIAVIDEGGAAGGDGGAAEAAPEAEARPADKAPPAPPAADEGKQREAPPAKGAPAAARADEGRRDEDLPREAGDAPQPQPEQPTSAPAWDGGEQPAAKAEPADTSRRDEPAAARYEDVTRREGDASKRGIISPLVRRLADEHNVDLGEVQGSGTGGRIRKQDVLDYIERRKAAPARPEAPAPAARPGAPAAPARPAAPAAPQPGAPAEEARPAAAREELVPWSNIRRRTAEHMISSHLETARAWNAVEADWTNVVTLRERAKEEFRRAEGFNLTYMPFLARVVCETLLEMPEVNATYEEENQANRIRRYVNLGIAVALEGGGLIVPVVGAADEKNLVGLARAINDIATRARSRKLSPDDLAGGTFTITNPGPFGSIISVPIIPRGQTGILGFEAIQKRVVVTAEDAIAIRSMGFLSMSWDHRTIDGAEAARFLARLRERVETTDFSGELSQYL